MTYDEGMNIALEELFGHQFTDKEHKMSSDFAAKLFPEGAKLANLPIPAGRERHFIEVVKAALARIERNN